MDPALLCAVEGLRAVQASCSEVILNNAGDEGDRPSVLACADIEQYCLSLLGDPSVAKDETIDRVASNRGNRLSLMPFKPGQLAGLLAGKKDVNSNVSTPDAGDRTTTAPPGSESGAGQSSAGASAPEPAPEFVIKQNIAPAHMNPVTDIIVLHEDDPMPEGFVKVTSSITGAYPADLNAVSAQC